MNVIASGALLKNAPFKNCSLPLLQELGSGTYPEPIRFRQTLAHYVFQHPL
jgi:hypothetical protein